MVATETVESINIRTESSIATEETSTPTLTPSPEPPAAAIVNEKTIYLEELNAEILRYLSAYPDTEMATAFQISLDNLIDETIFSQAAEENGTVLTNPELENRIADLIQSLGSEENFNTWLEENFYTRETFQIALERSVLAEAQRSLILVAIPNDMEQVELAQILVYDRTTADNIQAALNSGSDFDFLVSQYHPLTNGYLGWNPKGTLFQPVIEDTAFQMNIDDVSEMIETEYGFHFIKLLNKEIHPLTNQNRQLLEHEALHEWLETQKERSQIEIIATFQ